MTHELQPDTDEDEDLFPGAMRVHDGRLFLFRGWRDYTRVDGLTTRLQNWQGWCAACGEPIEGGGPRFKAKHGRGLSMAQRCRACADWALRDRKGVRREKRKFISIGPGYGPAALARMRDNGVLDTVLKCIEEQSIVSEPK